MTLVSVWGAGLVSLHWLDSPIFGPPHVRMRRPDLAHFLGDTSPQSDPAAYVEAVRSLCQHYHAQARTGNALPPLVVNTHGWIQVGHIPQTCRCPLSVTFI